MTLPEEPLSLRIGRLLAAYDGWGYDRSNVGVVCKHPAMPPVVRNSPYRTTNCSTLTTDLLFSLYPDAGWTTEDYGDLQVFADRLPSRPFAPLEAAARRGVAEPSTRWARGRWHLCQGWHPLPKRTGHAFLVYAQGPEVLVLEAQPRETAVDTRWTDPAALTTRYAGGLRWAVLRP